MVALTVLIWDIMMDAKMAKYSVSEKDFGWVVPMVLVMEFQMDVEQVDEWEIVQVAVSVVSSVEMKVLMKDAQLVL